MDTMDKKKKVKVDAEKLGKVLRLLLRKDGHMEVPKSVDIVINEEEKNHE